MRNTIRITVTIEQSTKLIHESGAKVVGSVFDHVIVAIKCKNQSTSDYYIGKYHRPVFEITRDTYLGALEYAKIFNSKVSLNVGHTPNDAIFYGSEQGISWLKDDGELGGLTRYIYGSEPVAKLHQEWRIKKGGYWLNCYSGPLIDNYKKQGFKQVAHTHFVADYAPNGWREDSVLSNMPDVVFLTTCMPVVNSTYCDNYTSAETLCKNLRSN